MTSSATSRSIALVGTGFSFFVMPVSGLMLTVSRKGRTAQAIDWHLAGLPRDG